MLGYYTAFTFASPFTLVAGTKYWVVFLTDTTSNTAFYMVQSLAVGDYASFVGKNFTGGSWSAGIMPSFEIIPTQGSSLSLWRSDANAGANAVGSYIENFMGFVTTTGSAGAMGTIITNGTVGGFSALVVGGDYYVSQTIGTLDLGLAKGQFTGTAISATQIKIPWSKKGNLFSVLSSGSGTATTTPIYKAPFDGTYTSLCPASTTQTFNLADTGDMATGTFTWAPVVPTSTAQMVSVPMRKGQYIGITTASQVTTNNYFSPSF